MSTNNSELNACLLEGSDDTVSQLSCMALATEAINEYQSNTMKMIFLVFCSSLVFLMQAGFAMICSGCVRKKNVQNTMLKNLLDVCGSSIAFYLFGYAFAFGGDSEKKSFIGNSYFLMMDLDADETGLQYAHWLFQFTFAATSATIVAGTVAERCQMNAYLLYSMVLTGFVYPVIVHNIWSTSGFLSPFTQNPLLGVGMIDFSGSGVVHVTGGITALMATYLLGPRKGRFTDDKGNRLVDGPKTFPGHSKSLQMLGTFLLWFGWFGFNAGGSISIDSPLRLPVISAAVVNSTLAGAMGSISALFTNFIIQERLTGEPTYRLSSAMNGALTGLAAITGSCGFVRPWAAVVTGFIAGLLYHLTSSLLETMYIDDAVDAIPVHLAGGIWGVIATGLFASPTGLAQWAGVESFDHVGWFYSWGRGSGDARLLACQFIGLIFIISWTFGVMFPFFIVLNYLGIFRADSLEELVGLDVSYHGYTISGVQGEVSKENLDEYYRRRPRAERWLMGSLKDMDERAEIDNTGVDRFE